MLLRPCLHTSLPVATELAHLRAKNKTDSDHFDTKVKVLELSSTNHFIAVGQGRAGQTSVPSSREHNIATITMGCLIGPPRGATTCQLVCLGCIWQYFSHLSLQGLARMGHSSNDIAEGVSAINTNQLLTRGRSLAQYYNMMILQGYP